MSDRPKEALIQAFNSFLLRGGSYSRINEARKQAEEVLGEVIPSGSSLTKVVDEAMEAAVVRVAPSLIQQSATGSSTRSTSSTIAATGFVLQAPKSGIGDRFSLDQDILQAAGAEFYSVSDRMELIVPADRQWFVAFCF